MNVNLTTISKIPIVYKYIYKYIFLWTYSKLDIIQFVGFNIPQITYPGREENHMVVSHQT